MMETIREFVEVRVHPTVVRLEESIDAAWITEAYHRTDEVRAHLDAVERALGGVTGTGVFLIGPYGSGKSHFLAYLTHTLRARGGPHVATRSLLNYSAENRLETIVADALGLTVGSGDRRAAYGTLADQHPEGVLLVLDELSEFLRSKPDGRAFNEDVRFLQFLGEWAQGARFFVLAAMQEAIEHIGDLEHGLYLKIKDRYRLRLRLTQTHVRDLIADHLLVKKDGYAPAVRKLAHRLTKALPGAPIDEADLIAIYPLHPATLTLLEEVRDRFSRTRGVVDLVVTRLAGDPARGIEPFLDQPWGALLTPDHIIDHFRDVLELQTEFQPLAQKFFPWYRKHIGELFTTDRLRTLAERLLRLLVLAHLSPEREGISAAEASWWLLFAAARLDPDRNRAIVEKVLETLADRGRYVRRAGPRYALALDDDGAERLERLLARERADLPRPEVVFEMLAGAGLCALGRGRGFDLFALPRGRWVPRVVHWSFHERPWALWLGDEESPPPEGPALCVRMPWGPQAIAPCWNVRPGRLELTPPLRELAALVRLRDRALGPELSTLAERRIHDRAEVFRVQVREAYAAARLITPDGVEEPGRPVAPGDTHEKWLDTLAQAILRRTYPSFERFAPGHGPLPAEALRAFMRFAGAHDLGARDAGDWVGVIREGYLTPMQLLKRSGPRYVVPERIDRNELVRAVLPLVEQEPPPSVLYDRLAEPVFGLVPDQVHVLLLFLLVVGEIDIIKGDRSLRQVYETLPAPRQYDRVVPARALSANALPELDRLCERLKVSRPRSWTVLTQRRAVRDLRAALDEQVARLRPLLQRLAGHEELTAKLERLFDWCATLGRGGDELVAVEQFLYEVGSSNRFLAALAELSELPGRLDRQLAELGRYRHLFAQDGLKPEADALGDPPDVADGVALDAWLARARARHGVYAERYAERHARWWAGVREGAAWTWAPPPLTRSAHLGFGDLLAELGRARDEVRRRLCTGLASLEFQARCPCGFDGEKAPIVEALEAFERIRRRIERELGQFFAQEAVRERIRAWVDAGVEATPGAREYLASDAPWPEVHNLDAFDEHLAGLDVVRDVDTGELMAKLGARPSTPEDAIKAFAEHIRSLGARRVRFATRESADPAGVTRWCVEQTLRHGTPLPAGLEGAGEVVVEAAWVGPAALRQLEALRLGDAALERVLGFVVDGAVVPPDVPSPLVGAAVELAAPTIPSDCEAFVALSARLYGAHGNMVRVARERWLERLEDLAETPLEPLPPPLTEVLLACADHDWLLLDAAGLPLLGALRDALPDLLPEWCLGETTFARVGPRTTTDAAYRDLVSAVSPHAFEKVDAIDALLHTRAPDLADLSRLAVAELHARLRPVRRRLNTTRPLLVFADHGFRLDPSGRKWTHGGPSTPERVVPVLHLTPRT